MTYIVESKIKGFINGQNKQITKEAMVSIDKKVEDFLWKLVRSSNGNHRIVPEVVNLVRV